LLNGNSAAATAAVVSLGLVDEQFEVYAAGLVVLVVFDIGDPNTTPDLHKMQSRIIRANVI